MLHVTDLRILPEFRLWLQFNNHVEGIVDLSTQLHGPIFEPLRDARRFAEARLDAELRTVAWPNGADLAPEFLLELVTGSGSHSS